VKTDSEGNVLWHRTYSNEPKNSFFVSVVQTGDGGYLATGKYGSDYAWLVRTDDVGNVRWNATFEDKTWGGSSIASSAILTEAGGYLVAGNLANNIWLAKFAAEEPEPPFSSYVVLIAAGVATVTVVAVVLLYFKKRKR